MSKRGKDLQVGAGSRSRGQAKAEDTARRSRKRAERLNAMNNEYSSHDRCEHGEHPALCNLAHEEAASMWRIEYIAGAGTGRVQVQEWDTEAQAKFDYSGLADNAYIRAATLFDPNGAVLATFDRGSAPYAR